MHALTSCRRLGANLPLSALALSALALAVALAVPGAVRATELEPNEFVTAPAGTTAIIGYLVYGDHNAYQALGGQPVTQGTHLNDVEGIARVAEYFDIGKTEFLVEFLQPFGSDYNARIGGAHYAASSGAGDTTLALAVWPINDKAAQRYLGLTLYMTVPDGAYNAAKTINLGGNRLVYDPEIAFHQGFGKRWSADISGDLIAYGDNTNAAAAPNSTLSQEPTTQFQAFLNYAWAPKLISSLGYEGERGGRQSFNGATSGGATHFDELRVVNSYAVTPAFQVLVEVNHQFDNIGGFKQDVGVTVRTLYAF
jgi:hypothetical protein